MVILWVLSQAFGTVRFRKGILLLWKREKAVEEHNVQKIVLGLPKHMSGDVGACRILPGIQKLLEKLGWK